MFKFNHPFPILLLRDPWLFANHASFIQKLNVSDLSLTLDYYLLFIIIPLDLKKLLINQK